MRNKLLSFIREYALIGPGDTVICAVSGGADSMALLWAMYRLREKLQIRLEAAHFNHNLRGEESDREETFVRSFCACHEIVCHVGSAQVKAGEKGLEAAARAARYAFFDTLSGKVATAHTADDNAETLLMHLVRGTGLKGLGGIAPVRGNLIRPMLTVTRQEVLEFLEHEQICYMTDSSNETDTFFRNRIRHHVMPLLKAENPSLSENLSATALRLRQDEEALEVELTTDVETLRNMLPAVQNRALQKLLLHFGIREPEAEHIRFIRKILYSDNPSAQGTFPEGIVVARAYGAIVKLEEQAQLGVWEVKNPGITPIPELGIRVVCEAEGEGIPVCIRGKLILRSRQAGDTICLSGGTKCLKKLFIDQKIPAHTRHRIAVLADDAGVVMIPELKRTRVQQDTPNAYIRIEML